MKYNIVKQLPSSQGQASSNRYQIKAFTSPDKMNAFLNKSDNACHWKEINQELKSGVYFQQYDSSNRSFKYINIKQLNS